MSSELSKFGPIRSCAMGSPPGPPGLTIVACLLATLPDALR
jgi:hypothetical protein